MGKLVRVMNEGYVAEYLRISDDDEDIELDKEESNSITNQRRVLESFIAGHEELPKYPVREFVDDGVSGVSFHRPEIQYLLREVRENKVSCIVIKDLSRFGRNYIEVGDYVEQIFPFLGVRFIAVSEHFDSFKEPAGIEIGFKNLIHDLYSRDLSKKIRSAKRIMQEKGAYSGDNVPFGYKTEQVCGKNVTYIVDQQAAQIVKKIFLLAADRNTASKIADLLNKEMIPTPGAYKNQYSRMNYQLKNGKTNLWMPAQVSMIIQNEVYLGTYICRKLFAVSPGIIKRNNTTDYIRLENHHERIIDDVLFQKAQCAVRTAGKRKKYNLEKNLSVLKGKVKCGYCGYGMSIKPSTKEPYYYCRMGHSCGSYTKIGIALLETTIWDVLQKFLEAYGEEERKEQKHQMQVLSAISKIKEKKRLLEIQIEHGKVSRMNIYYRWKDDLLAKEEYLAKKEEITAKEIEYKSELEMLDKSLVGNYFIGETSKRNNGRAAIAGVQCLTRELADKLIERIEVYGDDRIEVKWKASDNNEVFLIKS